MNCIDFEKRLHEQFGPLRLDAELADDLAAHASECAACRETSVRFRLLSDCIGHWRDQTLDVDIRRAVLSAHEGQSAKPEPRRTDKARSKAVLGTRRRTRALFLAAGSLALVVVALILVSRSRDGRQPPVLARDPTNAADTEHRSEPNRVPSQPPHGNVEGGPAQPGEAP